MKKKLNIKGIAKNGGIFSIVLGATFFYIFSKVDIHNILNVLKNINLVYFAAAAAAMAIVVLCEAINIRRTLTFLQEKTTIFQCISYSLIGIFFSSITPGASGGQPMQLYFMRKNKINLTNGILSLLLDLAGYELATILIATTAYIYYFDFLNHTLGQVKILLIAGFILNTSILCFIIMAVFSNFMIFQIVKIISEIIGLVSKPKSKIFIQKSTAEIIKYKNGAQVLKVNKLIIFKSIFTNIIRIVSFNSIPFWVYRSLGLKAFSFLQVTAVQSSLYISGMTLPLPGALGISEKGFLVYFRTIFPKSMIELGMILSRGISFYLMLGISGVVVLVVYLRNNLKVE